jgi:CRISPR/Cas system endoribonuclease Cas6 (RAMP superfamily)
VKSFWEDFIQHFAARFFQRQKIEIGRHKMIERFVITGGVQTLPEPGLKYEMKFPCFSPIVASTAP